jgi:NAD(P)-dependent dehydrogenase (short-subunit alcohol dehydrogenase family)
MRISNRWLLGLGLACGAYYLGQSLIRQSRWFSFRDRVVVISGGSRGLGIVLARQLVDAGAKVALFARSARDVELAVQELAARGGDVIGRSCDIRDQGAVHEFIDSVLSRWGRIDVLLNVAGIMQVGPLDAMTLADFHAAMDINCWGPLHATLAVLPIMRQQRWGRIVNIASIGGKRAVPHMLPYDTSKFALVGLSTGLRTELAKDGILVTTACPTLMRTGSPRNATFKGKHRQEYAWFSIGGSLPVASLSAERAAAQVLRACQNGDGELYISNLLNPPVLAAELAPSLTNEVLALVNYFLPAMGGIGQTAAYGYESQSAASPSVLTALGDAAARQNNEMRARTQPAQVATSSTAGEME